MENVIQRSRAIWLLAVTASALGCGCRQYVNVSARVVDDESGQPVVRAKVSADYMYTAPTLLHLFGVTLFDPRPSHAVTDAAGLASVQVTPDAADSQGVEARAPGYWDSLQYGLPDRLRAPAGVRPPPGSADPSPDVIIRLKPAPRPAVVLVVPTGYRGPVQAVRVGTGEPTPPTCREFRYPVAPPAVAEIRLPAGPITGVPIGMYLGRFADGRLMVEQSYAERGDVTLRWVADRGAEVLFMVGTDRDADRLREHVFGPGGGFKAYFKRARSSGGGRPD